MQREEEYRRMIEQREAEVREKEQLTESERNELWNIRERLQKEADLTQAQKDELEAKRNKLMREVEQREKELIERQKLTETEWLNLEKQEREAQRYLERKLAELKEKERLTEEERMEYEKKEEELMKILKITEIETRRGQDRLKKIKDYESQLLRQNEEMIKRHFLFQEELEEITSQMKGLAEGVGGREEGRERKRDLRNSGLENITVSFETFETITSG